MRNARIIPERERSPLQANPFAWGGCLHEGRAGEEGLVCLAQCWVFLIDDALGLLRTPKSRTGKSPLNPHSQLNMQTPSLHVYIHPNHDSKTKLFFRVGGS